MLCEQRCSTSDDPAHSRPVQSSFVQSSPIQSSSVDSYSAVQPGIVEPAPMSSIQSGLVYGSSPAPQSTPANPLLSSPLQLPESRRVQFNPPRRLGNARADGACAPSRSRGTTSARRGGSDGAKDADRRAGAARPTKRRRRRRRRPEGARRTHETRAPRDPEPRREPAATASDCD